MQKLSADQIATIISSLIAIALLLFGVWCIQRKFYWPLLLIAPLLGAAGVAIYYFGFYRFTRLF